MYFRPALVHTVAQRFNKDHALRDPPIRRRAGTGFLVTFIASNWLLSVVLAHHPHFLGQPENIQVFWGYGLFPDQPGNFVLKKCQSVPEPTFWWNSVATCVSMTCYQRFSKPPSAFLG